MISQVLSVGKAKQVKFDFRDQFRGCICSKKYFLMSIFVFVPQLNCCVW